MAIVVAETKIKSIKEILNDPHRPLTLPEYQRPYKWSEKHVKQLINDIIKNQGIDNYRIGSVVIHKDEDKWNIVDGQQRLVTLSIILHHLGEHETSLLSHKFDQEISKKHISNNYYCVTKEINRGNEGLRKFILEKCDMAYIVIDDLSEAFQFFDSQNARGKPLEAYDLLKAFHLGEMRSNSETEKSECNEGWKKRIDNKGNDKGENIVKTIKGNPLHEIFNNHLFRIRSWLKHNSSGYDFSKDNVDLFKGVDFSSKKIFYPCMDQQLLTDSVVKKMGLISLSSGNYKKDQYPFQINQMLINGKRFFEYVEMYIEKLIALRKHENPGVKEIFEVINSYDPRARMRTGDLLVRMLFENALLFYYDKFGDANQDDFFDAAKVCFVWSYSVRLKEKRVSILMIDNLAKSVGADNLFYIIENALTPLDVIGTYLPPIDDEKQLDDKQARRLEKLKKIKDFVNLLLRK